MEENKNPKSKYALIVLCSLICLSLVFTYVSYTFFYGNTNQNDEKRIVYQMAEACQSLCYYVRDLLEKENKTLDSQCLSELPQLVKYWPYTDWVCDVAHSPRKPEDNLKQNQCKMFLRGIAKNFVEVSPNCTIIRVYYNGKVYKI